MRTRYRHHHPHASASRIQVFGQADLALLQNFADQAVIAIENARLFDEVQGKPRDLAESLHQQTATADILKVIAARRPISDRCFEAMVASRRRALRGDDAVVLLKDGDDFRFRVAGYARSRIERSRMPINRQIRLPAARSLDRKPMHIADVLSDRDADSPNAGIARRRLPHACWRALMREAKADRRRLSLGALKCSPSPTSRSSCCRPSPTRR